MYDFLIGIAESIVRHGFSWSLAASVLFLILRQRKLKQKLKKHLPHLFADDEPNTHYINNQHIIMENQRRMMERMGLEWNVPTSEMSKNSVNAHKTSYISSSVEVSAAQDAARRGILSYIKSNTRRISKMLNKFKSRKFIMALATGILIILNDGLDMGLDSKTILYVVGIVGGWIIGESTVDAVRAGKEKSNDDDFTTPIEPRV